MKQNDLIILGILAAGMYYIYEQSKKQLPLPPVTSINSLPVASTSPIQQSVADGFKVPAPSGAQPLTLNFM